MSRRRDHRARRRALRIEPLEGRCLLAAPPYLLRDVGTDLFLSSHPKFFHDDGSQTFFVASGNTQGTADIWRTDGTSAGTERLFTTMEHFPLEEREGLFWGGASPTQVQLGLSLYRSDLTAAGTYRLGTGFLLADLSGAYQYFFGYKQNESGSPNPRFFQSDGTLAGTTALSTAVHHLPSIELAIPPYPWSPPTFSVAVGTDLYFQGGFPENPQLPFFLQDLELYKISGNPATITLVKDIVSGTGSSTPYDLVNVSGTLFFSANDGAGRELWKSNGTSTGTSMVKDIRAGAGANPTNLVNVNGMLFFTADDGVRGVELWRSNGTCSGTQLVADINSGSASSRPVQLVNAGGQLLFVANDGLHGVELWRSDGTSSGTALLRDIMPGAGSAFVDASYEALGNFVGSLPYYFWANDGIHGAELWRTDGQASGTALVADIRLGPLSSALGPLLRGAFESSAGAVYFSANDGVHGMEPWLLPAKPSLTVVNLDAQQFSDFNPVGAAAVGGDVADGLRTPIGAAYDAAGNLFVSDVIAGPGSSGAIFKFDPLGKATLFADSGDGLIAPTGMAFDAGGNLLVANYLGNTVRKLNPAGVAIVFADAADGLNRPFDVAVNAAGTSIYVVNLDGRTVQRYNTAGVGTVFADAADGLLAPIGAAVDAAGNVFVADVLANKIVKFTPAGVGSVFADGGDGLTGPTGMSFDAAGNLYVANYFGDTVVKLTPAGVGTVYADAGDGLSGPFDVAIPAGTTVTPSGLEVGSKSGVATATTSASRQRAIDLVLRSFFTRALASSGWGEQPVGSAAEAFSHSSPPAQRIDPAITVPRALTTTVAELGTYDLALPTPRRSTNRAANQDATAQPSLHDRALTELRVE